MAVSRVSSKCCDQWRVLLHVDVDGLRCQPLLSTAREIAALASVDLLDKRASDDRRIMFQLLKDFRVGSQGLRGVQSTGNLFVVTKRLLSNESSSDGRLVQTPLWFLYPFAVCSPRVSSARLRSACFPTNISSALIQAAWFAFHSVCLMLNISATSSNHISRSVVPHVFTFFLQKQARIVSNALVTFMHFLLFHAQ